MLVLLGALVLAAVACGGREDSASEQAESNESTQDENEPAGDGDAFCEAAQDVVRVDDELQGTVNDLMGKMIEAGSGPAAERKTRQSFQTLMDEMMAKLPSVVEAYDRLESSAPSDLKQDIVVLSDFTVTATEKLSHLKDFNEAELEKIFRSGTAEAVEATLRIDRITRERCNIVFAN